MSGLLYSLFKCIYHLGVFVSLLFPCFPFLPPLLLHLFFFTSLSFHSPRPTLFIPIASNIISEWMQFKSIPLTLNPCPRSFKSDYELSGLMINRSKSELLRFPLHTNEQMLLTQLLSHQERSMSLC